MAIYHKYMLVSPVNNAKLTLLLSVPYLLLIDMEVIRIIVSLPVSKGKDHLFLCKLFAYLKVSIFLVRHLPIH